MAEQKNLPKKVRISYQDVVVEEVSPRDDDRLEDSDGLYQSSKSLIRIKEGLHEIERVNTLIHECLHASWYVYGMREVIPDKDKEEFVCNTLGNALTQILLHNPEFLEYIKSHV